MTTSQMTDWMLSEAAPSKKVIVVQSSEIETLTFTFSTDLGCFRAVEADLGEGISAFSVLLDGIVLWRKPYKQQFVRVEEKELV